MTRLLAFFLAIMVFAPFSPAQAQTDDEGIDDAGFYRFLNDVRVEAIKKGIRPETVDLAFQDAEPIRKVVRHDRSQSEFKLTFDIYRNRVISPTNIRVGKAKAREYDDLLTQIENRYGVQRRFILAIWGMETRYGAITGDIPLVPAIATLAYDKRRSAFFKEQLMATLKMLDRGYIDIDSMKGSWAGAMGQPQFIPTSYLAYAADFDGDGKRDIWRNEGDVFASIANYLAKHGWDNKTTWGRQVRLPKGFSRTDFAAIARTSGSGCRAMRANITEAKSLAQWQAMGVRNLDGSALPTGRTDLTAWLVLPDGSDSLSASNPTAFLAYGNYKAILGYNCAHLYAATVGLLADAIAE
ncbi:MAG: lytic murein transglycosylase [Alphaproteobacteria bacterium]